MPQQERAKIVRNSAKCVGCGHELVSTHVHDFKQHRCTQVAMGVSRDFYFMVDGGREYIRRGWGGDGRRPEEHYTDTSIYE